MARERDNEASRVRYTEHRRLLCIILLLALLARVGFAVAFHWVATAVLGRAPATVVAEDTLFADAYEYGHMADHILTGHGPMISEDCRLGRMPGYAFFLAGVRAVFGRDFLAVRLVEAVVATGVVWLVARLARELFGPRAELWAAGIAAVYPFFVVSCALVLSETLFMALLVGGLLCLLRAMRTERVAWAVLAGFVLGLATLTRASLLHGVFLLVLGWVVWQRFRAGVVLRAACLLAVFAATLAPWVARNYGASGGHFVVTTSRAGASLYEALNPQADGGPMLVVVCTVPRPEGMDEVERDRQLGRLAVEWAAAHPGRAAWLALVKLGRFWSPVPNAREFRGPLVAAAVAVPYVAVMMAALLGLRRSLRQGSGQAWRRGEVVLILLLPVVYHSLLHMVFVGSIRYREALMPLVVVLAAHGLSGRCALAGPRARPGRAAEARGEDAGQART